MKKTLLAVALAGLLFGCSDDKNEPETSTTKEANTAIIAEFKKDYINAQTTIRDPFNFNKDKLSIAIENDTEEAGKFNFDLLASGKEIIDNSVEVGYLWLEKSKTDLKKYSSAKGSASVESSLDLQLTVVADKNKVFDSLILSNGAVKTTLDATNSKLERTITFTDQKSPIAMQGDDAGELGNYEIAKATINDTATFDNGFSSLKSLTSTFDLSEFKFETAAQFAPLFSGKLLLDKASGTSKLELSPLLLDANGVFEKLSFQGTAGSNSYSVDIPKISLTMEVKEKNKLTSGKFVYTIDDVVVDFSDKGKANFGHTVLDLGIEGINNEKAIAFVEFVQSIKDSNGLSAEQEKEMAYKLMSMLSKESAIKHLITNKISTGEEFVFNFSIKPTEKFVALTSKGMDELENELSSISEVEAVTEYLESLEISVVAPENYLVEQYANTSVFNNTDRETAKKEAKDVIGQSIMMLSMAAATKGITPLIYEKNIIKINISYKNQKWTINGKTLSTDELFKLGM